VSDERPTYRITLRAGPNVDGIKAVRKGLKILGRRLGLQALSVEEVGPDNVRPIKTAPAWGASPHGTAMVLAPDGTVSHLDEAPVGRGAPHAE
jgi:hypothetical protein